MAFRNRIVSKIVLKLELTMIIIDQLNLLTSHFRKESQPSFIAKFFMGMTAGAVGAFVGTPAEVALIRMTADGRLPLGDWLDLIERNYLLHNHNYL